MKKITLLVTGAAVCFALSGCSGNDPAADGRRAVSLQDMAVDISREADILPGGAQEDNLPKSTQEENSAGGVHNLTLEEIKDYLAQYPDSLQELAEEECYVVMHGKEYSGRKYLDSFIGNVQADVPDELVIVQFTTEGDPILIYLNTNTENVYCVEDASRDAWAGNGERYFEKTYDSVWLSGEADTEGNYYLSLYALQEQDMVVEVFSAATDEPFICGLPTVESSTTGQTAQPQPQTEPESRLPRIEDLTSSSEEGGNCIELHELPEWAKPPAP